MGNLFACVGRDLLRVVTLVVEQSDAARPRPRRIHGDALPIGRVCRVEGVLDKFAFVAGSKVEHPHIPVLELSENVARL